MGEMPKKIKDSVKICQGNNPQNVKIGEDTPWTTKLIQTERPAAPLT